MLKQENRTMTAQIVIIILLIGLVAGILSGLVGIGGGIVLVPALVFFLGYTQHQAQGTSLGVLTFPVVILAFLKYYTDTRAMGHPIDMKIIGLLAITFIIGAFFGSRLALRINQETLKKIFGVILLFTAFKMLKWDSAIAKFVRSVFGN